MTDATPTDGTQMYRLYNADGVLLYVGISWSALNRITQHRAEKDWWIEVHRVEITTIPGDRTIAEQAERQAIRTECPLYNVTHNGSAKAMQLDTCNMMVRRDILTLGEAEKAANVSRSTLRRRLQSGQIPGAVRAEDGSYAIPFIGLIEVGLIDEEYAVTESDQASIDDDEEIVDLRFQIAIERERRQAAEAVAEVHRERADDLRVVLDALTHALLVSSTDGPTITAAKNQRLMKVRWQRPQSELST